MSIRRAIVSFPSATGLPEDRIQNVFHFIDSDTEADNVVSADIAAALSAFYSAVDGWMPAYPYGTATPTIDVDHYVVGVGGVTGQPIGHSNILGFTPTTTVVGLPLEVSVALSFHGNLTGIDESVPQGPSGPSGDWHLKARRRGRVFIGPLNVNAIEAAAGSYRPSVALQAALSDAGAALKANASLASSNVQWAVYSRKADTAYPVVGGWVDNEFDTQRRRGRTATLRDTFV